MEISICALFLGMFLMGSALIEHSNAMQHVSPERASKIASSRWSEIKVGAQLSALMQRRNLLEARASSESRTVYVTDLGADASGGNDSTAALQNAIDMAFNISAINRLVSSLPDLGGVELHLEGGDYTISNPLRFPTTGGGNLLFHGGTIRASVKFPSDGYLIELQGGGSSHAYPFEDITFKDMMLDAGMQGGGLHIANSVRTTVENLYVSHFKTTGIFVESGHETYISNCFLGQYITAGGDPNERSFGGIGINLESNDNIVDNSVIFSAQIGILVKGQANLLTGNHMYNKATGFGGVGIYLQLPGLTQTRILSCYMDWNSIVADDPAQLEIADSFFLGDGNIVLKATKDHVIDSVIIKNNIFSGNYHGVPIVQLDERSGRFLSITRTTVTGNTANGMQLRETVSKAVTSGIGLNIWKLDFSRSLLFNNMIQNVQYSVYCEGRAFPRHVVRSVLDNIVVIETDIMLNGTVSAIVDQCSAEEMQ